MFPRSSIYFFCIACVGGAGAQENSARDVPAGVVSATRSQQSLLTVPGAIAVISREEIERSGARHIADVLRGRGAVQINDTFGDGSRATVGMRGFNESANANVLVLVDGRRLNNTDIGAPDLNSISLKDVERVEIVQGSAGTLFGDQAVGGVINIITRRPTGRVMEAVATVGSYGRRGLRARLGNRFSNGIDVNLTAERFLTDNYRRNNRQDYENYLGRVGYEYG
ncbi:MAG: TonB-dependent receptor, partial [Gammaproteobacteria bacterium]